jgi:hypothetical protein
MGLPRPDASTPVHDYIAQHRSQMVILNWPCARIRPELDVMHTPLTSYLRGLQSLFGDLISYQNGGNCCARSLTRSSEL